MIDDEEIRVHSTFKKMLVAFNGNEDRIFKWYYTTNMNLPEWMSPAQMIERDMSGQLDRFIDDCLSGFQT